MKSVTVIGGGISGLSAAAVLAKEGYPVTLLEKNDHLGGRMGVYQKEGFTFDMGPSWYWMPDIYEEFFDRLGYRVEDLYQLKRLDPSYRVFWHDDSHMDIPASVDEQYALFDRLEPNGGSMLRAFMDESRRYYEMTKREFLHNPSQSIWDYVSIPQFKQYMKLPMLRKMHGSIKRRFNSEKAIKLLSFPVLFLGGTAQTTPAFYSLMNYADFHLGTWYPMGGMHEIIKGYEKVLKDLGVRIKTDSAVDEIRVQKKEAVGLRAGHVLYDTSGIISAADYAHTEQCIPEQYRNYTNDYWKKRTFAPTALLAYVGVKGKVPNLLHHNLFFDGQYDAHLDALTGKPDWPERPLFYVCCPSKTDPSVAPADGENLFILIPYSTKLPYSEEAAEKAMDYALDQIERRTGFNVKEAIVTKDIFTKQDFISRYNAYGGNAYGLANTLRQTAFMKPKITNKHVSNIFYCGQLTVPGPGVPPAIISGTMAADLMIQKINAN